MNFPGKLTAVNKISGDGNFGEVYLCENPFLNSRKEAVKHLKGPIKNIDELKNRLFESSVLEYLRECEYIVNIYSAQIQDDDFFISMEYMENGSVQKLLDNHSFLSIKRSIKIAECVLQALEYAHNKNILHLDIKPGNILIKNDNIFKLSDFGLSGVINKSGVCDFKQIYTPNYPPETFNGQSDATKQTDIYMLGVTLYRLVNGDSLLAHQRQTAGSNIRQDIINGKIPERNSYLYHIPKRIIQIINKCISIDLSKRYNSVRDIRKDLGKLKIKYNWEIQVNTPGYITWNCYLNNKLHMDLWCEKNNKDLWDIDLYKIIKGRLRVKKHCHKNLKPKDLHKNLNKIFNEYFSTN